MKKLAFLLFTAILFLNAKAQEKFIITTDDVKLYVNVKGEGIPCIYLHGGPGSGSYWLEKFFGEHLEKRFQMIYLDQRGVARSTSPKDGNYSMDRMIKDFEEVRAALGIDRWLTMGHSFGGLLQMEYVLSYPESIMGMLMINASLHMEENFNSSWCPKASEFLGIDEPLPCMDSSKSLIDRWGSLIQSLNEQDLFWKMGYADKKNMEVMNASFGEIENWNWEMGNAVMGVEDYWQDYQGLTSQVKVPVLFFYGKYDWMVGPNHFKGAKFPNIFLWESNVGHMPFMENRSDLEKAIDSFTSKFSFE